MEEPIRKLSKTRMSVKLTHLHVNSYFMSKVYFSCGVMELIGAQHKELRRKNQTMLERKLRLGINFPWELLHSRAS